MASRSWEHPSANNWQGNQGPQYYHSKQLNLVNNLNKKKKPDSSPDAQKGTQTHDTLISAQGDPRWTWDHRTVR